jgi:hypothetical protein
MMTELNLIKSIHTLIWLFFNVALGYIAYAVVVNQIDHWVWIGVAGFILEALVLLHFRGICPLTPYCAHTL